MKLAKTFVWLGFIALLAISIPKVAWVVRSYEGVTPMLVTLWSVTIDLLWLIPLFVAVCIDVLIMALTYAVSNDKARASKISMWVFVGLLCGLSCYCNLLYNYAHSPSGSIWSDTLVSSITPYIIAGVPLFALCYTLILSRLNGNAETLAEKVTRLEADKALKLRLGEAKKGRFTGAIKSAISAAADVATHTQQTLEASRSQHKQDTDQGTDQGTDQATSTPQNESVNDTPVVTWSNGKVDSVQFPGKTPVYRSIQNGHRADTETDTLATLNGHSAATPVDTGEMLNGHRADTETDTLATLNGHSADTTSDIERILQEAGSGYSADTEQDTGEIVVGLVTGHSNNGSSRSTHPTYVALKEAVTIYGYAETYLTKLVQRGSIKTKRNDRSQLLVSSLEAYIAKNSRRKQDSTTPALTIVS